MKKVLLFNPRAAKHKPRIPNSVLQVAASLEGKFEWVIIDGNREDNPAAKIFHYLRSGDFDFFACTVMPGPQLQQAIPISKDIREHFPEIKIIWGGYFPSNQPKVCLDSGFVDVIINGPGDKCFPELLSRWSRNEMSWENIPNLIFKKDGGIFKTRKDEIYEQDELPGTPNAGQTVCSAFDVSDPLRPAFIAQIPLGNLALPSGALRNKKSINLVYVRVGAKGQTA